MIFDYQIFFLPKLHANEVVTKNEDGSYTIFINDDLCEEKKLKAIKHAFWHIENEDFSRCDVQSIESEAHS